MENGLLLMVDHGINLKGRQMLGQKVSVGVCSNSALNARKK
jgi:hypothetical protein